jgi:hypothetical protein
MSWRHAWEMRDLRAAQWNFGAIKPPCHACHRDRSCPSSIVDQTSRRRARMAEFSSPFHRM